jgi:hypothetical protein
LTKQIDANWAEGTNQGGFPSGLGAPAIDTWYRMFLIGSTDGTSIDAGYDSDSAAANLLADAAPSSYAKYRRYGWVLTDAASNIIPFIQRNGGRFDWVTKPIDYNVSNPGVGVVNPTISAPPGSIAILNIRLAKATAADPSVTGRFLATDLTIGSAVDLRIEAEADIASAIFPIYVDSSSQIQFQLTSSNANTDVVITTEGWIDTRGAE